MHFRLNPPSGHSDSYLDVLFQIMLDKKYDQVEIKIFNDTSNEQLDIVGVMSGWVINEQTIINEHTDTIEGYINIFNDDKMNIKLSSYNFVDIRCEIIAKDKNDVYHITNTTQFYNESKSLDCDILPFELIIDNPDVDISNFIPVSMQIVCDIEKEYELCVKSEDSLNKCHLSIFSKKGRIQVELPSEILYSDLELHKPNNLRKQYSIYYVKPEGVNFSRLKNKKYIPVPNGKLKFIVNQPVKIHPQSRRGPDGKELSRDFILSDRYFVHTHKDFTSLSTRGQMNPRRLMYLTRFMHEAQDMFESQYIISSMSDKSNSYDKYINNRKNIQTNLIKKHSKNRIVANNMQHSSGISSAFFHMYEKQYIVLPAKSTSEIMSNDHADNTNVTNLSASTYSKQHEKNKQCLPCSRKRQQK